VWDEIYSRLTSLKMAWIFEPKDVKDALQAFTRELAGPKAKSLGWTIAPDEDHIQRQFKSVTLLSPTETNHRQFLEWQGSPMTLSTSCSTIVKLTCRIVKVAQSMFEKWTQGDKSAIHPDLRSAVFAIALKNGGKKEVSQHTTTG